MGIEPTAPRSGRIETATGPFDQSSFPIVDYAESSPYCKWFAFEVFSYINTLFDFVALLDFVVCIIACACVVCVHCKLERSQGKQR